MGITQWLDEATPDRCEVQVCFDRRLLSELAAAKDALKAARDAGEGMLGGAHAEAEARVKELAEQVRGKSRTFVFEGVGWGRWRDLLAKYPQAPDQSEAFARAVQLGFMPHAVENVGYDAETFIPAAIAASCVEPGVTVEEATAFLEKMPAGVIDRLWGAVLEVNLAGSDDPFVEAALAASSGGASPSAKKSKRLPR